VVALLAGLCGGVACPMGPTIGQTGTSVGGACPMGGSNVGVGGTPTCAVQCAPGMPQTTISGTVYDPAGTRPLYGIYVYVTKNQPAPITPGNPTCTQCQAAPAPGDVIAGTLTDENGKFTLTQNDMTSVPSGSGLTLVLQTGKWRRQYQLPVINPCTDNPQPGDPKNPKDPLRLPAKGSEGDMPLIAFTSGCDIAECFLRDIGISDSEFVPPGSPGNGHVVFYTGKNDVGDASHIAGGNTSSDTYAWWTDAGALEHYDIIFNACECLPYDRGPTATAAMEAYLQHGGRLFATHYYYNWFAPADGPTDEQSVVSWALPFGGTSAKPFANFYIDPTFPKGNKFALWLQAQNGQIALTETYHDMNAVTPNLSTRWMYNADIADAAADAYATTSMSFNSPVGMSSSSQCGRAVVSDLHVSGTLNDQSPPLFPNECPTPSPDPTHFKNEQALEFLFFNLASCVQDDTKDMVVGP
jgi:hypothetical protein